MISALKYGLKAFFILPQSQQNARIITIFSQIMPKYYCGCCATFVDINEQPPADRLSPKEKALKLVATSHGNCRSDRAAAPLKLSK